jgi:hypothetical protein
VYNVEQFDPDPFMQELNIQGLPWQIKELNTEVVDLNKSIAFKLAEQQEYQRKLEDVRVPTIFGKDISDPDLTIDEWQGMLGDQNVDIYVNKFIEP